MKQYILAAITMAALAGSATAGLIWSENWNDVTTGAGPTLDAEWSYNGTATAYAGTSGPDESVAVWGRKTSTLDRFTDVTSFVDATNNKLQIKAAVQATGLESAEGDTGWIKYTKDSGSNWSTLATYTDNHADWINESFDLNVSTWTAGELAGFGIRFEQVGSQFNDNLRTDDISISSVPEPATIGMVSLAGAALLFIRRRIIK
ncbi:hypothetical protein PDESU_01609 [Pontiella desulfatans]|uniref:PEP-CTERM protein-sorting domain-containing protein n=1 Tax=Pontiella desulfatans TaxID=2750659 RepID=A0A6C2TZM5_PONDE|nr:PEP-CTERM sorting domain-containing protein [Pontiella desulfatans]VGO13055.1 hypothetical protein PDESU_01609 [Pontiella desulfatans]